METAFSKKKRNIVLHWFLFHDNEKIKINVTFYSILEKNFFVNWI